MLSIQQSIKNQLSLILIQLYLHWWNTFIIIHKIILQYSNILCICIKQKPESIIITQQQNDYFPIGSLISLKLNEKFYLVF